MKKRDELEYNKWVDHLNNTRERTNYAIRRMDLLIISICGGGIYIIFETIREMKGYEVDFENEGTLIFSGITFLFGITTNFISQVTGYRANHHEENYTQLMLKKIEKKDYDKEKMHNYNCGVDNYNKWTNVLNIASIALMFIGLALLTIFNYHLV
ncbi:NADH:ubiquinone oxidoreductase subunit 3 (subunit A) [Saonia flava]|uniref:NADH:ubiquinone oxidoreductase subunit 3 (Subunit A) n=1 Tax=Saonia flava TaxID=523696 RepID=A0A846R2W8_9FLAO|nr:hypothetical protein [Saonia flava]NJB72305.1 NADH:ubiquinone oxidoreductase subunit 3 (subunit A) [Saonia flava]